MSSKYVHSPYVSLIILDPTITIFGYIMGHHFITSHFPDHSPYDFQVVIGWVSKERTHNGD